MLYALGDRKPYTAGDFYVAPGAAVIGDVNLGPETSVWFGAVIRGDVEPITIGRGTNIQDGSVLHADPGCPLILDEYVTVGHQVMLHGCRIGRHSLIGIGSRILNRAVIGANSIVGGRHSLIGIGSRILNRAVIGANSIVGAHALITEDKVFPEGVLILGSPAKVARDLTDDEIAQLPNSAQRYIDRAKLYRKELSVV